MKQAAVNKRKVALYIGLSVVIAVSVFWIFTHLHSANDKPIHIKAGDASYDWNENPSEVSVLEEMGNIVAKVKYTGKARSYKLKGSPIIRTAYLVDVVEVIEGNVSEKQIEIIGWGGKIPLGEYIKNCSEDELEADPDLLKMSKKAISASTYEDTDYLGVDFTRNDEAVVFLQHDKETKGKYEILFGGLGLFEKNEEEEYVNEENQTDVVLDAESVENL